MDGTWAEERVDDKGRSKLNQGASSPQGHPDGDVRPAWHAKEVVRSITGIANHRLAVEFEERLSAPLVFRSEAVG